MKKIEAYECSAHELETILDTTYNTTIFSRYRLYGILEHNNSCLVKNIEALPTSDYYKDELTKYIAMIADGKVPTYGMFELLSNLVNLGVLHPGTYIIDGTW